MDEVGWYLAGDDFAKKAVGIGHGKVCLFLKN
jgi:hypothetical protein